MIPFSIPKKLNGEQLLAELAKVGIHSDIPVIMDEKLWLSINETEKSQALQVIENHSGLKNTPTIQDKLNAAGIDLDELRAVLGL